MSDLDLAAFAAAALRLHLEALNRCGDSTLKNVDVGLCEDDRTVMIIAEALDGQFCSASFELEAAIDPNTFDRLIYEGAFDHG